MFLYRGGIPPLSTPPVPQSPPRRRHFIRPRGGRRTRWFYELGEPVAPVFRSRPLAICPHTPQARSQPHVAIVWRSSVFFGTGTREWFPSPAWIYLVEAGCEFFGSEFAIVKTSDATLHTQHFGVVAHDHVEFVEHFAEAGAFFFAHLLFQE